MRVPATRVGTDVTPGRYVPTVVVEALSGPQQRVVDHDGGALRVVGGAGTGKTTALVHRYLRLASQAGPDRVLVLARDHGAARRFRDAVMPRLRGAWDDLPVTTSWGFAFDLLTRAEPGRRQPQLLRAAEQRALVRSMLRAEVGATGLWPTLGGLVGRRAFADEVAGTVLDARAALLDPDGLRAAGEAGGGGPRWQELAAFYDRYLAELGARRLVDSAGVLAEGLAALERPDVAAAATERHAWVLADDYEATGEPGRRLLARLADHGSAVTTAVNPDLAVHHPAWRPPAEWRPEPGQAVELRLDHAFRAVPPGSLVRCRHPAMEPEAVAGELRHAHDRGVPWDAMVVLVRDGRREQAVARALSRHAIPVAHRPGQATEEPTVRGLLDLLRAANGDDAAFDRLLISPLADLDPADVRRIRRRALAEGTPLAAQPEVARLAALRDELAARAPTE
ncbi:MAG TPA: UvrD-helicase domain-containing protein, partial [Acidimicrobiales bacterium]|nr:UvrD-helicase domain-containing protein [Acidimicrobiales bacterium]